MKPRICQILHGLEVGGAEVLAARLATQLKHRFSFEFLCLDSLGSLGVELRESGFFVRVLNRRSGLDLRCAWEISRYICDRKVSLVQAHQYTPFFYSVLGRSLSMRRCPVLFTEHGRHQPDFRRPKRVLANRLLLRGNDRVVAVGSAVRDALVANEGIASQRIKLIYNGVSLERFELGEGQRAETRASLGLSNRSLAVMQVARLDYLKDHATAVRAMARVVTKVPNARLFLVGEGSERANIEALVAELDLGPHVRLLGQRADTPALLSAADVVLLTSISEGIPLTLIEAMAASRPVVSTNVGGVAEVVVDGETGCLAPAQDFVAIAERICDLAVSPDRRRAHGERGAKRACALFAEKMMHSEYALLYEEMCLAKAEEPSKRTSCSTATHSSALVSEVG